MSVKDVLKPIPLQYINANTFTGAYQAINLGLPEACSILKILNDSDVDVFLSLNGVTDHDYIPSGYSILIPAQMSSQPGNYRALFAKGTIFYVRGAAGTGSVFLSGFYQS